MLVVIVRFSGHDILAQETRKLYFLAHATQKPREILATRLPLMLQSVIVQKIIQGRQAGAYPYAAQTCKKG